MNNINWKKNTCFTSGVNNKWGKFNFSLSLAQTVVSMLTFICQVLISLLLRYQSPLATSYLLFYCQGCMRVLLGLVWTMF